MIRHWLILLTIGVSLPLAAAEQRATELGPEAYALLKATYGYDAGYPLGARSVGSFEQAGTTWEKLSFTSFHDGLVPALLAVPEGEGPFPVVLLLHGLTGNKRQWLSDAFTHGGEVSAGLLTAGYAVLALDAQYHGDRAVYNDFVDPGEMVFQRGWGMRYANLMTQTVVDYRRAIDYLQTRDDIDAGRKEGLSSDERAELVRLRRELRVKEMEIEILKRASAYFARENVLPK